MNDSTSLVKRDTAILATAIVSTPVAKLYGDDVPDGTRLMNFQPDDPDAEDILFAAEEKSTREPLQHTETGFPVRWWVAKAVTLEGMEDGEPHRCIRLALISADLDTLILTSIGSVSSFDLIRTLKGDGPYDPAILVKVKPERTNKGRTVFRLRLQSQANSTPQS